MPCQRIIFNSKGGVVAKEGSPVWFEESEMLPRVRTIRPLLVTKSTNSALNSKKIYCGSEVHKGFKY
jgi:hypothetical protein